MNSNIIPIITIFLINLISPATNMFLWNIFHKYVIIYKNNIYGGITMDKNFTGVKDGIVYDNGKPILETFTRSANIKNAPDPNEIVKQIKKEKEKEKEGE